MKKKITISAILIAIILICVFVVNKSDGSEFVGRWRNVNKQGYTIAPERFLTITKKNDMYELNYCKETILGKYADKKITASLGIGSVTIMFNEDEKTISLYSNLDGKTHYFQK
jgi:hypothetical protein